VIQVLFGLGAALAWGFGDFFGGFQARRLSVLSVVIWSQLSGLAGVLLLLAIIAEPPVAESIEWGAIGGLFTGVAVLLLYRGLASGVMGIVAPLSACGVLLPVLFDLARGEIPTVLAAVGMVAAVLGIVLVSLPADQATDVESKGNRPSILMALGAALGFGLYYILVGRGTSFEGASPLWAIVGVRIGSMVVPIAIVATRRGKAAWPGARIVPIAAIGLLDTAGNALFAFAALHGPLGIAAVLVSLYPVVTVALGRTFLAERLSRTQAAGVTLALGGVGLITAG
jgi:drug/metabolite transporter (DMT)-like permease